jgi:hypothetical protein
LFRPFVLVYFAGGEVNEVKLINGVRDYIQFSSFCGLQLKRYSPDEPFALRFMG